MLIRRYFYAWGSGTDLVDSQGSCLAGFFRDTQISRQSRKIQCDRDASDNEVKVKLFYSFLSIKILKVILILQQFFVYYKDDCVDFTFREYTKSKFLKESRQDGARRRVFSSK